MKTNGTRKVHIVHLTYERKRQKLYYKLADKEDI